jgi:hypothetical protein
MYHAERVDKVVRLDRHKGAQFLRISLVKASLEPEHFKASTANRQALARNIDAGNLGAGPGEVDGVSANSAAYLKHLLAIPARELGELRDMLFDEILSGFDFVEKLTGTDWFA